MDYLLKIGVALCLLSEASKAEFVFPHECDEWLQECQPILYPDSGSAMQLLTSPGDIVKDGRLNLDCSPSIDASLARCELTEVGYCAIPFNTASIRRAREYICTNAGEIVSASGCWTNPLFLSKWNECGRMAEGSYCSPAACLEDKLTEVSDDVCSHTAKSHVVAMARIFLQALDVYGVLTTC